ncbi:MAG: hypothetical protein RR847_04820 [Bacilli bacterium]
MNKYHIIKNKYCGPITINYKKITGFKVKPRNKINHKGIKVDSLSVVNMDFIEMILKKKNKRKLEVYLQYIISVIDDDGETDPDNIMFVLDDVARYKSIINSKYRQYLDDLYIELLLKKVDLLEQELKTKMFNLKDKIVKEHQSRRSR